jgi:N-methylhydantoinase A
VDIGGTFTDLAASRPDEGVLHTYKLPSTPPNFDRGFVLGMEALLEEVELRPREPVIVIHGTTVATNAVIERRGPRLALLTTKGFRDVLELERLKLRNPLNFFETRRPPLIPRDLVFEIDERIGGHGEVITALDRQQARSEVQAAHRAGAQAFAVALLNSYRNPAHEHALRDEILAAGGTVSLSSDLWPRIGEYERAITAVLNEFVRPAMSGYLGRIEAYLAKRIPNGQLMIMRSNGGVMSASTARQAPVQTLLSGPAAGVTASEYVARQERAAHVLTLDMGGTSTDISLISDFSPVASSDAEVGTFPVAVPVTELLAIGAGGGSVIELRDGVVRVGPRSVGSDPGPVCFGRGGQSPTLTDAYLLCGYLPDAILGGRMPLDRSAAEAALAGVAHELGTTATEAGERAIAVASSGMVASILPFLARHGTDPGEVALMLFGGCGAIQGPILAEEIGVERMLVPPAPSVHCAIGGLVSDLRHDAVTTVMGLNLDGKAIASQYAGLVGACRAWVDAQITCERLERVSFEFWAAMRFAGQSFTIDVRLDPAVAESGDIAAIGAAFVSEYERLYTYSDRSAPVEFVDLRARVNAAFSPPRQAEKAVASPLHRPQPRATRWLHTSAGAIEAPVYARATLAAGVRLTGPAIIEEPEATLFVPQRYSAAVQGTGTILLTRGQNHG